MRDIPGTEYIHPHKEGYDIVKKVDGKNKYLGHGQTLIIALMRRDWCEAHNWEKWPRRMYPEYIYENKRKGGFDIRKKVGDTNKYLGYGRTLIEALMKLDWCKANDWEPYPHSPPSYIVVDNDGLFRVQKTINKRSRYYGRYPDKGTCRRVVEVLKKIDWDVELWTEIRDIFGMVTRRDNWLPRYVTLLRSGHYGISKITDGVSRYYGTFNSLDDVKREVELLESVDWDFDAWCELVDERNDDGDIIWLNRRMY